MSVQHLKKSTRFPNGGWLVRYRSPDNRTLRKTFASRQEANDFHARVRVDKKQGTWVDPRKGKILFRDVAEEWLATTGDLREKTRVGYRSILNYHVVPEIGHLPIERVATHVVRRVVNKPDLAVGTRKNILRAISPIFNYAIEAEMIRVNPCRGVKLPKTPRPEITPLTAEQVAVLADTITPQYRTMIYFAAYTGMRAGEIVALQVKNVDLFRRRATVARSCSDVRGRLYFNAPKNGKVRTVPLPGFLVELLTEQTAGKGLEDFVFPGTKGGVLRHGNVYSRHFKPAVKRALPPHLHSLRFHDLRHTAASLLIAAGTNMKAVSEWLGHSSIAITFDVYGHLFAGHDEEIVKGLDATYGAAAANAALAPVVPFR